MRDDEIPDIVQLGIAVNQLAKRRRKVCGALSRGGDRDGNRRYWMPIGARRDRADFACDFTWLQVPEINDEAWRRSKPICIKDGSNPACS